MKFLQWLWESTLGNIIIGLTFVSVIGQLFLIPSASMEKTLLTGDLVFASKLSYGTPIPRIPIIEQRILPDFFNNDHIFLWDKPTHGEIVIFTSPKNNRINLVKRCVATSGDILFFKDKKLFINFKKIPAFITKNTPKHIIDNKVFFENPYQYSFSAHNDDQVLLTDKTQQPVTFSFPIEKDNSTLTLNFNNTNILAKQIGTDEFFMVGDNMDHSGDSRYFGTIKQANLIGKPIFIFISLQNMTDRWNRIFKKIQ